MRFFPLHRQQPVRSGSHCGISQIKDSPVLANARIASGMEARPGAHPWVAAIYVVNRRLGQEKHHCGGVIISKMHVLTAAHCMVDYPLSSYRVKVGDWDIKVGTVYYDINTLRILSCQR